MVNNELPKTNPSIGNSRGKAYLQKPVPPQQRTGSEKSTNVIALTNSAHLSSSFPVSDQDEIPLDERPPNMVTTISTNQALKNSQQQVSDYSFKQKCRQKFLN